jgi:WD40 repeat protein
VIPGARLYSLVALVLLPAGATAQAGALVLNPVGHTPHPAAVALSPDGKSVFTLGGNLAVRGWDAEGRPTFTFWLPPGCDPQLVQRPRLWVSPDGGRLAFPYYTPKAPYKRLCVVDLADRTKYRVVGGGYHVPDDLAFSPDGRQIATVGRDPGVKVWDVATGKLVRALPVEADHRPTAVAFTPDGKKVTAAVAHVNTGPPPRPSVRTWRLADGKLVAELPFAGPVTRLQWSPDGRSLAVTHGGGHVKSFDAEGKSLLAVGELLRVPRGSALDAAGRLLAVWEEGVSAVFRDEGAGRELCRAVPPAGQGPLSGLFSRDGRRALLTREPAGEVVVIDLAAGRELSRSRVGHPFPSAVGWSPDGGRLAWGAEPGVLKDVGKLRRALRLKDFSLGPVGAADAFTRARREWDGVSLRGFSGYAATVVADGKERRVAYPVEFDWDEMRAATLLPGGRLLTGGSNGLVAYDVRTGKEVWRDATATYPHALAPSPDGKRIAVAGHFPTVRVYPIDGRRPAVELFVAGDEWVAWLPTGEWAGSANAGSLAGRLSAHEEGKLRTFIPLSARKAKYRPDRVRAALRP